MFEIIKTIFGFGREILGNRKEEIEKSQERQARINEAELNGAPPSSLRLWRSFLGWALSVAFVWEVMIRPAVVFFFPETELPPSMLKEISSILLGMLGLGF